MPSGLAVGGLLVGCVGFVLSRLGPYAWLLLLGTVIPLIGALGVLVWTVFDMRASALIIPHRVGEAPSFWRRNRDDLLRGSILAFVSATVGTLLGVAVTLLVKSH